MTKLTIERLGELANATTPSVKYVGREIIAMARQLLAYEQAAKNPVAWIVHMRTGDQFTTDGDFVGLGESTHGIHSTPLYAAPVLPKRHELISMQVSIDTGGDNIGHRLFGEIVGASDSNGVPVLCIEVSENNADVTLADEGETYKIIKAAEKLVRCKGRYHSEQNYRALAALFGVTVPDLPPLPADEAPAQPVIPEQQQPIAYIFKHPAGRLFWSLTDESNKWQADVIPVYAEPHELKIPPAIEPDYEVIKGILPTANPDEYACCIAADTWNACRAEMLKAQPVSEPYKLKDAVADIRNSGVEIDADKINAERDTLNSPVIPDGWKLVPIEPTAEMAQAARDCHEGESFLPYSIYRAMLAVSPAREQK